MLKEDRNGIIRNEKGWPVKGQSLNPAGRPPERVNEEAREVVRPLRAKALQQLEKAIDKGQAWAIQLQLAYDFGKPTDHIEVQATAKPEIDLMLGAYGLPSLPAPTDDGENDNGDDGEQGLDGSQAQDA
jgi:hypothetical protein